MIKLIATDMDGTFLRDDKTYDRALFAQVHRRMQDAGIQWVVASGNQYFQIRESFTDYPDTLYIADNGAYIGDAKAPLNVTAFLPTVWREMLARLVTVPDIEILISGANSAYVLDTIDPAWVDMVHQYYRRVELVPDYAAIDDQILKFALTCPPERTSAIAVELQKKMAGLGVPTSAGHGDIDIIQPGLTKARGLAILGEQLGIDLSEMAAFGDGGNDLEMLQEVGLGVAMANASPEVAAIADATTTTNAEQGVLTYIAQTILPELGA